jgi:hypothetical protein
VGVKKGIRGSYRLPDTLTLMSLIGILGSLAYAFTAYDCTNRSNIVESYSLLDLDACSATDKNWEVETTMDGEILQKKQERIIPILSCQVIETIVSLYCGHWPSAGVTSYVRFREPEA